MIHKPYDWKEVDDDFLQAKPHLPVYQATDLNISNLITTRFSTTVPQVFILLREDKKYIVDTQGYDYVRYIQRLT